MPTAVKQHSTFLIIDVTDTEPGQLLAGFIVGAFENAQDARDAYKEWQNEHPRKVANVFELKQLYF